MHLIIVRYWNFICVCLTELETCHNTLLLHHEKIYEGASVKSADFT